MTIRLNPYLGFRDEAKAAMEFYQSVLGGELTMDTFGSGGMSDDPAEKDKIMHAQLETESGMVLMASDTPASMEHTTGSSVSLSLSGDDEATLRRCWEGLTQGGTVTEPLEKAPWGDTFGMCTDRCGTPWMITVAAPAEAG